MKTFVSIPVMMILCLIYIIAIGAATFIENAADTDTARALIYDAHWLEVLYLLIIINLIGNFIRCKLWRLPKLTIGLIHVSFVIILSVIL